jgi:outer membrane protein TolC
MKRILSICLVVLAGSAGLMAEEYSLQQAVDIALKQNAGLQGVKYKLAASQAQVMTVRGSLMPGVSVSGSAMRMSNLYNTAATFLPVLDGTTYAPTGDVVPSGSVSADRVGNAYAGKLSAIWPIYTGGRVWQGYQITRLSRDISLQSLDSCQAKVVFDVKQAYYDLLMAQSFNRVTQEAVTSIQKHVDRVKALYQNGMVSKYDLLRAEVQLSNLQPRLIQTQNAVALAKQALNMSLNRDLNGEIIPTDSMQYQPVEVDSAALKKAALETRPEYKSIILRQKIVDKAKLTSFAGYQPAISLLADYTYYKGQGYTDIDKWQKTWDVGIAASWSLFDGGASIGKIREASANQNQIRLAREQVEDWIELEVSAGYLTLKASEKTIFSQQLSVGQAEEALKIAKARYESGQATNLDVLDAQLALTQAQTNRIQAVHDYLVSLARLEKAVGQPIK